GESGAVLVGAKGELRDRTARRGRLSDDAVIDEGRAGGGPPDVAEGLAPRAEHQRAAVDGDDGRARLAPMRLPHAYEVHESVGVHRGQFSTARVTAPAPIGGCAPRRSDVHPIGGPPTVPRRTR